MLRSKIIIYLGHKLKSTCTSLFVFYFIKLHTLLTISTVVVFCKFQKCWVGRTNVNIKISGDVLSWLQENSIIDNQIVKMQLDS